MLIIKRLGIVFCITIIFVISFFISTVSANPDTFGGEVTTVPGKILPTVSPREEGIEDEVAGNQSHFPDNPETYLPMPLPQRDDLEEADSYIPEGSIVSYDLLTGEETISDSDVNGLPLDPMDVYGKGDQEDGRVPLNFSGLSLVQHPTDWPFRPVVKIFFSQGSNRKVCSGSLIDPLHVITAGHCIHEGNGGSWSYNVVVVPAYDYGDRPYGDASGVQLHSWTGWTSSGSHDHDIGIIDLDRPIGGITGWYGYMYENDCGYFTSGTWRHSGYPKESPYDGERMYTQTGDFDWCETYGGFWGDDWYGNEVLFHRRSYGGQSGSGAKKGNNVYAVLSNGNLVTTWDVRIIKSKFEHIRETFIADDTPATFDLIPMNVQVSPSTIKAGNQLSSMSYVVHNYSSASWSGYVNVSVYLSTDDNISSSDTLINSHYFWWDFGSKDSLTLNVTPPPSIPGDKSGNYYIGVILDISDYNTSNNDSDGQDASAITVLYTRYKLTASKTGTGSGTVTSSPPGINCGSDCSEYYTPNTAVTLSATPATGSTFRGWSGACTGMGSCVVSMTNDKTVTAHFGVLTHLLTVSKTGTGSGIVTSSPSGIKCGSDCSQSFAYNTTVTLTATPEKGSSFGGWSGACSGTGSCVVTMTAARSVTASFKAESYLLTVSKTGPGRGTVTSSPSGINCGSDCSQYYKPNTVVTLTAAPGYGSTFTGWSGACSGTSSCVVTMTNDKIVTARFTYTNSPPYTPSNPAPPDNSTNVSINTDLSWTGGDPDIGDNLTYDVYFSTAPTPGKLLCNAVSTTTCDPGTIYFHTRYYWYVISRDNHGSRTTGPIWKFYTGSPQTDYQLFVPIIFR
ncbi:trypsin-like serine protease [Chloroflexota bacterium]